MCFQSKFVWHDISFLLPVLFRGRHSLQASNTSIWSPSLSACQHSFSQVGLWKTKISTGVAFPGWCEPTYISWFEANMGLWGGGGGGESLRGFPQWTSAWLAHVTASLLENVLIRWIQWKEVEPPSAHWTQQRTASVGSSCSEMGMLCKEMGVPPWPAKGWGSVSLRISETWRKPGVEGPSEEDDLATFSTATYSEDFCTLGRITYKQTRR